MEFKDYKKYKWFFTSSKKLVIGGKSASQNDELLKRIKAVKEDYIVMHTSSPGSPFSVIISKKKEVSENDREEAAIFTGCFSQTWKNKLRKAKIHIFSSKDVYKLKSMKTGTWGVKKIDEEISVDLKLVLIYQEGVLRAVPEKTAIGSDILIKITPGNIDKKDLLPKLATLLDGASESEILSALPAGGIKIK
jgi:hypothetical protein